MYLAEMLIFQSAPVSGTYCDR